MAEEYRRGIIGAGRQDCSNMHSFGPGIRTIYIVHYIINGRGYFTRGSETWSVEKGESFVIRPFEQISYRPDSSDPWEYTWIEFTGKDHTEMLNRISFIRGDCIIGRIDREDILPLYDGLSGHREVLHGSFACGAMALAILGVYADRYHKIGIHDAETSCFCAAKAMIQGNYHIPDFGLSSICSALGISRVTLHRDFVRACGSSPGAYLSAYRMERAKELLERGVTVKAAAHSCGFSDQLYFSKAFRKFAGESPGGYGKRHRTVNAEQSDGGLFLQGRR